eukprot:1097954-Pyramimonas_sp.AAC.1
MKSPIEEPWRAGWGTAKLWPSVELRAGLYTPFSSSYPRASQAAGVGAPARAAAYLSPAHARFRGTCQHVVKLWSLPRPERISYRR